MGRSARDTKVTPRRRRCHGVSHLFAKSLLSIGLIGLTVGSLGQVAVASFTASTDVGQAASAGRVAFASIDTDGPGNRLSVPASDLAAGDTAQRAVELTNDGSLDMDAGSVRLTTVAPVSSMLDTDPVDGLQLAIDSCPVPWTESGTSPVFTYTCPGPTSVVLAPGPVIRTAEPLSGLTLAPGVPNHLRVTVGLPTTAGDALSGSTSSVTYTFTGAQRAATAG
jgi:spore coat-associated protein N